MQMKCKDGSSFKGVLESGHVMSDAANADGRSVYRCMSGCLHGLVWS